MSSVTDEYNKYNLRILEETNTILHSQTKLSSKQQFNQIYFDNYMRKCYKKFCEDYKDNEHFKKVIKWIEKYNTKYNMNVIDINTKKIKLSFLIRQLEIDNTIGEHLKIWWKQFETNEHIIEWFEKK